MRNFFKRQELPDVPTLMNAFISALHFLNPDMEEELVKYEVLQLTRKAKSHKQLAKEVNAVCKQAVEKLEEITELEVLFNKPATTTNNN